jgi:hypothetical protein
MRSTRTALLATVACFPIFTVDAQSPPPTAAPPAAQVTQTLVLTASNPGAQAAVVSADGRFRIVGDRIEISPDSVALRPGDRVTLEAVEPGGRVTLRITRPGTAEPVMFTAERFTVMRDPESGELHVRGVVVSAPKRD